jgi:hypothetical protein
MHGMVCGVHNTSIVQLPLVGVVELVYRLFDIQPLPQFRRRSRVYLGA